MRPSGDQSGHERISDSHGLESASVLSPIRVPEWWNRAAVLAALLFGLGGPISIFIAQFGIFGALLLGLLSPTLAWRPLRRHPVLAAALAFYLSVQLTAVIYAQDPLRALICLRGDWPVLFLPIFLVVLQRPRARQVGLFVLLGTVTAAGALGLWQHFAGIDPLGQSVLDADGTGGFYAVGSLNGHLTYGGVMLVGFVTSFCLLLGSRGNVRMILGLATLGAAAGLITSYARTAWFGAGIGVLAGLLIHLLRGGAGRPAGWIRRLAPGLGLLLLCAAIVLLTPGLRERLWQVRELGSMPRMRLWLTAWRIFEDFPLFGAGLGAFKSLFESYRPPGYYMATGHPHSDPLNTLTHSGLAGLLAWGGLWCSTLVSLWRSSRSGARTSGIDGLLAEMRLPLGVALVLGFLSSGLAQCYFTDEEPAAMLWFAVALLLSAGDGVADLAAEPPRRKKPGRRLEKMIKKGLLPLAARIWIRKRARSPEAGALDFASLRRILLVRQDSRLGNLVLMTPFLQALRSLAPQARIEMAVGDRFAATLSPSPWLDGLIIERKRWLIRHPWAYPAYAQRLRRPDWDVAFELSNPDTHSFYNAFLTALSDAPLRVGFDHPRSRAILNAPVAVPETECHYSLAPLMLLAALGADPPIHPLQMNAAPSVREAQGNGDWLIHPGGRGRKGWGAEAFGALLRQLDPAERDRVRLIGGPGEADLLETLSEGGPPLRTAVFRGLDELLGAFSGAAHYLGCDAGPLHLAAATGLPTLSLFRSSHPLRYAPLGESHMCLLVGDGSRSLANARLFPAPVGHPGSAPLHGEPSILAALSDRRPRTQEAPDGSAAQVSFVLERWREALASRKQMCEDPAAGNRV